MSPNRFGEGGAPDIAPKVEEDDLTGQEGPSTETADESPHYHGLTPPQGYQLTYGRSRSKRPLVYGLIICIVCSIVILQIALLPALGLSNGLVGAFLGNNGSKDAELVGVPTLLYPTDGSMVENDIESFYWTPVTGADNYTLVITEVQAQGWVLNVSVSSTEYTLTDLKNGATYQWSVAAMKDGQYGRTNGSFSFTSLYRLSAPVASYPLNTSIWTNDVPTLRWASVVGADEYRLQVAEDPEYKVKMVDLLQPGTDYQPSFKMFDNTTCYWRVMAHAGSIWSTWGSSLSYTYRIFVPSPMVISPANSDTVQGDSVDLEWTMVENATDYRVQVSNSSYFTVLIADVDVPTINYTLSADLQENTSYYWRVQAGHDGGWSAWCPAGRLYVGFNSFTVTYTWTFQGTPWTLSEVIPGSSYYAYHDQVRNYDYASYVTDTDPLVVTIATELRNAANAHGYDVASFVLSFVQSIPYTVDLDTTGHLEYPRYSVETLVDHGGDCEDKAALYASLMRSSPIGIDAVLLEFQKTGSEGHMAVGIAVTGHSGKYYTYGVSATKYFYCETTAPSWSIGQFPLELDGYEVSVLCCPT